MELKKIFEIIAEGAYAGEGSQGGLAVLNKQQMGVERERDPHLHFRMWGGKDAEGNITKWLAKDKEARVKSLVISETPTSPQFLFQIQDDENNILSLNVPLGSKFEIIGEFETENAKITDLWGDSIHCNELVSYNDLRISTGNGKVEIKSPLVCDRRHIIMEGDPEWVANFKSETNTLEIQEGMNVIVAAPGTTGFVYKFPRSNGNKGWTIELYNRSDGGAIWLLPAEDEKIDGRISRLFGMNSHVKLTADGEDDWLRFGDEFGE